MPAGAWIIVAGVIIALLGFIRYLTGVFRPASWSSDTHVLIKAFISGMIIMAIGGVIAVIGVVHLVVYFLNR
jgi:hypothetical protein